MKSACFGKLLYLMPFITFYCSFYFLIKKKLFAYLRCGESTYSCVLDPSLNPTAAIWSPQLGAQNSVLISCVGGRNLVTSAVTTTSLCLHQQKLGSGTSSGNENANAKSASCILFLFLFGRQKQNSDLPFTPAMPTMPGIGKTTAKGWKHNLHFPHGGRNPVS